MYSATSRFPVKTVGEVVPAREGLRPVEGSLCKDFRPYCRRGCSSKRRIKTNLFAPMINCRSTVGEVVPAREGLRPVNNTVLRSSISVASERLFQQEKD